MSRIVTKLMQSELLLVLLAVLGACWVMAIINDNTGGTALRGLWITVMITAALAGAVAFYRAKLGEITAYTVTMAVMLLVVHLKGPQASLQAGAVLTVLLVAGSLATVSAVIAKYNTGDEASDFVWTLYSSAWFMGVTLAVTLVYRTGWSWLMFVLVTTGLGLWSVRVRAATSRQVPETVQAAPSA